MKEIQDEGDTCKVVTVVSFGLWRHVSRVKDDVNYDIVSEAFFDVVQSAITSITPHREGIDTQPFVPGYYRSNPVTA